MSESIARRLAVTLAAVLLVCALWAGPAWADNGGLEIAAKGGAALEADENGFYAIEESGTYDVKNRTNAAAKNNVGATVEGVTLNLNGVNIQPDLDAALIAEEDLTLNLNDANTVRGLNCEPALTVSGTGALHVLRALNEYSIAADTLKIQSGTVSADDPINAEAVTITGGSVNANFGDIPVKNGAGTGVFRTAIQLQGAGKGAAVTGVSPTPIPAYEFAGAQTDASGTLYFYLPEGTQIASVTAGGDTYTGEATANSDLESQTFLFTKAVPLLAPYTVTQNSATGAYTNNESGLTITEAGDYTVETPSGVAAVPVTVTAPSGSVKLTLNGVETVIPAATQSPALLIAKECGADVEVVLKSAGNALTGGKLCAGIQKQSGAANVLSIGGAGRLSVTGGEGGAGIGGGSGQSVANIVFTGGTVRCVGGIGGGKGGSASGIRFTGGSVNADVPEGCDSLPVAIRLDGAAGELAASGAEIELGAKAYDYGLTGVVTDGETLYFWLPSGATLKSVTAGGKVYTGETDLRIVTAAKTDLYPPQFEATDAAGNAIANTYRDGLKITGDATVKMAAGVKTAGAPIYAAQEEGKDLRVAFHGVNVDTGKRRDLPALQFAPASAGKTTMALYGKNVFSALAFVNRDQYDVEFACEDESASLYFDGMMVAGTSSAPVKALSKIVSKLLMNLPGASLKGGGGAGAGRYAITQYSPKQWNMSLTNLDLTLDGLIPAQVHMTIDKHSALTLKKDAVMVLLTDSTMTGEGRINVDGRFTGKAEASLNYRVDASATGGRPLTLTGVTGGYAKAGETVTATVGQAEDFIQWEIEPAVAGLDLTAPSVSFTADQAYALRALYRVPATGVSFDKPKCEVETGDSLKLTWAFKPDDATDLRVTLASDHPEIAEVDEAGVVYGVSAGSAVVTLTTLDGGFTATCAVTVTDAPIQPLDVPVAAVKVGSSMKLTPPSGYEGVWSTADAGIASVSGKKLKAVKLGETVLTFTVTGITSKHPGLVQGKSLAVGESASVPLKVRKKKQLASSVAFGAKKVYLAPDEEMALRPTLKPKTALDTALAYRTGDARVARVSGGKLIAMGLGKTHVTATAASFAERKLTVVVTDQLQALIPAPKKVTVPVNGSVRLTLLTQPLGLTNVSVAWTSKKPGVAAVEQDGTVLGIKKGKATVIARSGGKKATFTVTVK